MSRTNANLPVSEADALRAKLGTRRLATVSGILRPALREDLQADRSPRRAARRSAVPATRRP
jgi:hypothetical protein